MTETLRTALLEVRRVVTRALAGQAEVVLFGSCARGDDRRRSDIDVGIVPHVGLPPGLLANLRADLEESSIPYRVELVDLSLTSATFRARALAEGIAWSG